MATDELVDAFKVALQNETTHLRHLVVEDLKRELNHVENTPGVRFAIDSYVFMFVVVVLEVLLFLGFVGYWVYRRYFRNHHLAVKWERVPARETPYRVGRAPDLGPGISDLGAGAPDPGAW